MSARAQIVDAVVARLRQIRLGATFDVRGRTYTCQTDLGHVLAPGRLPPLGEGEPAVLRLHAGVPDRQTERAEWGLDRYVLAIALNIQARGAAAEATVLQGAEDIRQAVASDKRWGGLARWSGVEAGDIDRELAAQKIYGLTLVITIEYTTNSGEV